MTEKKKRYFVLLQYTEDQNTISKPESKLYIFPDDENMEGRLKAAMFHLWSEIEMDEETGEVPKPEFEKEEEDYHGDYHVTGVEDNSTHLFATELKTIEDVYTR